MAYKLSKKQKLEQFDKLKQDHDRLELALHSLTVARFPFSHCVVVRASEFDSQYAKDSYKLYLSVSDRSLALYLVRWCDSHGKVTSAEVIDELDIKENIANQMIAWRMIRFGLCKIRQKRANAANVARVADDTEVLTETETETDQETSK